MKFKISAKELENLIPASSILSEQKASKEEVEEGGKVSIRVDRGQGFTYDLDVKAKEFTVSGAPDKFKRIVGKRKISATKLPKAYRRIMDTLQSLYKVGSDDDVFKAAEKEVSGDDEKEKAASGFDDPSNLASLGKDSVEAKVVVAMKNAFQSNPKSYEEMLDIFREKKVDSAISESDIRQMVRESIRSLNEQIGPDVAGEIAKVLKGKLSIDFELGDEAANTSDDVHLKNFINSIPSSAFKGLENHLKKHDTVAFGSLMKFLINQRGKQKDSKKKEGEGAEGEKITDSQIASRARKMQREVGQSLRLHLGVLGSPNRSHVQDGIEAMKRAFEGIKDQKTQQKLYNKFRNNFASEYKKNPMKAAQEKLKGGYFADASAKELLDIMIVGLEQMSQGRFKEEEF
tara:strand:- start:3504 stop:4709 length:1206 start_codon:yes stop_codon:yes gene_type:complete